MHKYILHGLGKNPHSFWAYHLREHHVVCNRCSMIDPGYQHINLTSWNTQSKEIAVLFGIVFLHLPIILTSPTFVVAVYTSISLYYFKHRKSHLDPEWAKKHLPWHYEHHLGDDINVNWCVTWPWFDYLMQTRVCSEKVSKQ